MIEEGAFQSIVVGYDGSPSATRALGLALMLARSTGARLCLVHARQMEPEKAEPTTEEEFESVDGAVADNASAWTKRASRAGVSFTVLLRDSSPSAAILEVAEDVRADLIVVGTRGLGPLAKAVLGSVSSTVVGGSHVPVLVVP